MFKLIDHNFMTKIQKIVNMMLKYNLKIVFQVIKQKYDLRKMLFSYPSVCMLSLT